MDKKKENLLKVPDGLHKLQVKSQKLQSLPIEGESQRCEHIQYQYCFFRATPKLPYKTGQCLVSTVQDIQNKKSDVCGSPIFLVMNMTETNRILLYLLSVMSACLRVI